ncbi:MAG: hypothetical protein QM804_09520 [Propionicimonas sp.]
MDGVLQFIESVGRALWGVWTLNPESTRWLADDPNPAGVAITIAVLAGASTLVGNSVVLFVNRVRGVRFAISLLINGLGFVLLYAVQALIIAVVGYLVTGERLDLWAATWAVLLSTAPLVFGFFELIPYLGTGIARLLQAWGFIALWAVVDVLYQVGYWRSLLIVAAGWGVMQLASWLLARPLAALGLVVWRLTTGLPGIVSAHDLLSGHLFGAVELDLGLTEAEERSP